MSVREYIGARYVPIFSDPLQWYPTSKYEPLTIVTNEGASYVSRRYVPEGIPLSNTDYWVLWADFNAQLQHYIDEVDALQNRVDAVDSSIPISEFSSENTVKKYIDDTAQNIDDTFDEELGKIVDHGFLCVSTDRGNANRPAYAMYTDDFKSMHYVDLFIPEYFGLDKRTPVDSSCLAKIGDYYYYAPNRNYAYSDDFENWAYATMPDEFFTNNIYPGGTIWTPNGIVEIDGHIYWMGSLQYKSGTAADYGIVDAFGKSDDTLKKACYIEVIQNTDGSFSVAPNAQWIPFACTNIDNTSYIDGYAIYSTVLGSYLFVVKNEISKKLEIYSGSSLSNMSRVNIDDNLFGVEAPKVFEDKKGVYVVATVYEMCGYGLTTAGCVHDVNPAKCVVIARITNALGTGFAPRIRWHIVKEPIDCRHVAVLKCDKVIGKYIHDNGYDSFEGYRYNGYQDNLRIGFSSPVDTIDDTKAYGNFYINIVNAPGINYSLEGSGAYINQSAITKEIPINSLLAFNEEDNDNYLISRSGTQFTYKLGSGFLASLTNKIIKNTESNIVLGKFINFNNTQCAYMAITGFYTP